MVEIGGSAHEIVDHRQIGALGLEDVVLHLVEGGDLVGGIATEVQIMGRGGFADEEIGQLDLVEAVIFHRPEDIAPGGVERVHRTVFGGQPVLETGFGGR